MVTSTIICHALPTQQCSGESVRWQRVPQLITMRPPAQSGLRFLSSQSFMPGHAGVVVCMCMPCGRCFEVRNNRPVQQAAGAALRCAHRQQGDVRNADSDGTGPSPGSASSAGLVMPCCQRVHHPAHTWMRSYAGAVCQPFADWHICRPPCVCGVCPICISPAWQAVKQFVVQGGRPVPVRHTFSRGRGNPTRACGCRDRTSGMSRTASRATWTTSRAWRRPPPSTPAPSPATRPPTRSPMRPSACGACLAWHGVQELAFLLLRVAERTPGVDLQACYGGAQSVTAWSPATPPPNTLLCGVQRVPHSPARLNHTQSLWHVKQSQACLMS